MLQEEVGKALEEFRWLLTATAAATLRSGVALEAWLSCMMEVISGRAGLAVAPLVSLFPPVLSLFTHRGLSIYPD